MVEITSDPGMDSNYATGDDIEVTATFDQAVAVTGKPRIEVRLGDWQPHRPVGGVRKRLGDDGAGVLLHGVDHGRVRHRRHRGGGHCYIFGGQRGPQRRDDHGGRDRGGRLVGLHSGTQRQRAPGQLGAADAVERRDVDGRDKGDPDLQRESGPRRPQISPFSRSRWAARP